jgi:hypothetical protein
LGLIFAITFAALNTGHLMRYYGLVRSPLASPEMHRWVGNETLSASGAVSNFIRNIALATATPFPAVNRLVNGALASLHALSGRGLNDPDITFQTCTFSWVETHRITDGQASYPLHFLLILIALGVALIGVRKSRRLLAYAGLVIASFVLFCALLRWQQWHSRMHLPYLVLLMPFVAVVFVTRLPAGAVVAAAVLAASQGVYTILKNDSRPLRNPAFTQAPREAQYMAISRPHLTDS